MTFFHYGYAGLRVTSELSLPDWSLFESARPFENPDVIIRTGPANPPLGLPGVSAKEYVFRIPDVGTYSVRDGSEITVVAETEAGEREVRLFLLGTAWGVLCYQRGLLVLHAGVVQWEDGAIAFCGPAGSGKSSAGAWLVGRGWRLIGDDLCRFETTDGGAVAYPSAPRVKLWREALEAMSWPVDGLERDHFRLEKYQFPVPVPHGPHGFEPVFVRAIYLLDWGELSLTRLTGSDALRRFVAAATYRPELIECMGLQATHWERCLDLARRTTVWRFTRPRDWAAVDGAMDSLLVHVRHIMGDAA